MRKYTPRSIEEFVVKELKERPEHPAESIVDKFLAEHGAPYERYLQDCAAMLKDKYSALLAEIDTDSEKTRLREKLIEAMRHWNIISNNEKGTALAKNLMGLGITFTCSRGGGYGGDAPDVGCDFLQIFKYQTDFPEGEDMYPARLLAYGVVFHELGHRLSSFSGAKTIDREEVPEEELRCLEIMERLKRRGRVLESHEESFAQGISKLVMDYLGLDDAYTAYYKRKEAEIQALDMNMRARASKAFTAIKRKAVESGHRLLSMRSDLIGQIYTLPKNPHSIEKYANPLPLDKIKRKMLCS